MYVFITFNDTKYGLITHAPTVQRSSVLLLLAFVVCDPSLRLYSRDVSQAYTQSFTKLSRPMYVKTPAVMKRPRDIIICLDRPLYGLPEAAAHRFKTHHNHHTETLGTSAATYNPCLLYTAPILSSSVISSDALSITCLQIDDVQRKKGENKYEEEIKLK